MIEKLQLELTRELSDRGVPSQKIDSLVASGYYLLSSSLYGMGEPELCVADSFYGSKWWMGLTPLDTFLADKAPRAKVPTYTVASISDIERILALERHRKYLNHGRLCFRGQSQEYSTYRPYPNPVLAENGRERLIIPSFWRRFRDNWSTRFDAVPPHSIFQSMYGDHLTYYGIPDWQTLPVRNLERYGPHTMSELEDFPDPESQEYGRRWRRSKVEGTANRDLPLVEQHYGIDTCGLDVTFDFRVATFFATNKFRYRDDGTAFYEHVDGGLHTGVVYGFVFRDPPLKKTAELVTEVASFNHIPPTRPVKQQCALPFFHSYNMNEAVCDLDFVMYLDPNFDRTAMLDVESLFPSRDDDPFYGAVLDLKSRYPSLEPFSRLVEYRWV